MEKKDILEAADVKLLIDEFYSKAMEDDLLGPVFKDVAKINLEEHLPHLYAFWEMLILGNPGYTRQPYPAHIRLGLQPEHFERWLKLFGETIHENFKGMNVGSKNVTYPVIPPLPSPFGRDGCGGAFLTALILLPTFDA